MGKPHLFHVLNVHGDSGVAAWLVVLIGISIGIVSLTHAHVTTVAVVALVVGLIGATVVAIFFSAITQNSEITIDLCGPWIAWLGCGSLVVGGMMLGRRVTGEALVIASPESESGSLSASLNSGDVAHRLRCEVDESGAVSLRAGELMAAFGTAEMRQPARERVATRLLAVGLMTEPPLTKRGMGARTRVKLVRKSTCERVGDAH